MSRIRRARAVAGRSVTTFALTLSFWLVPLSKASAVEVIDVDAVPPPDPGRHGFYLRFEPRLGALFLWSRASVLSDFEQNIKSSASGTGWGWEFQIGRRLVEPVALAAVFESGTYRGVRAGIRDESVFANGLQIETFSFGLVATVTPFADLGWHGSVGLKAASIDTADSAGEPLGGPQLRGAATSVAAGYELRLSQGWWLGAGARIAYFWIMDPSRAATHAVEPGLVLTATYY